MVTVCSRCNVQVLTNHGSVERPDLRTCRLPDIKRKMLAKNATTSDLALNQVRKLDGALVAQVCQGRGQGPGQGLGRGQGQGQAAAVSARRNDLWTAVGRATAGPVRTAPSAVTLRLLQTVPAHCTHMSPSMCKPCDGLG